MPGAPVADFAAFPTAEVLASPKSWIETDAVQRLEATAALPGMVRAVAMPNLHPARAPIGAVLPAPAGSTRS